MAEIVSAFPTSIAMTDSGVQRNAEAYVYAAADTSLTTPLAITDLQGVPFTGGKLTTTTGQFPQFKAPPGVTQVLVLSGGRVTLLTDVSVYAGAAQESATAAAGSAGASDQARAASVTAKGLAEKAAADALAVGATTDAQMTAIQASPTSAFSVAQKATIAAAGGVTLRAQNDQDEERNMALRRFRVGMAGIDSAPVVIFTETDSIGEGYNLGAGGAWNKTDRPMDRLLAELNRRLTVTGAPGAGPYVPVRMASSVGPATGWPWTLSGSPALSLDSMGPGIRTNIVSGTQYVEYAALGITKFRVFYGKGPLAGTLRIRLDGTVVTTIPVNDVSVMTDGYFYDVTIPDTSAHAVRIDASAGAVFVHGGMPLNGNDTKGWQIIEGGHSSAGSKVFVASTPNDARKVRRDQIAAAQPHLYYLELGANDFANDSQKLTAAAFKTNVQAMIADARTASTTKPSIVLGAAWELNAAITPLSPWKDYRAALYDIAAGDADIVVFDMAQRVRTAPPLDNARGLLSDLTHLSTAGSRAWARDFAQFLLA